MCLPMRIRTVADCRRLRAGDRAGVGQRRIYPAALMTVLRAWQLRRLKLTSLRMHCVACLLVNSSLAFGAVAGQERIRTGSNTMHVDPANQAEAHVQACSMGCETEQLGRADLRRMSAWMGGD